MFPVELDNIHYEVIPMKWESLAILGIFILLMIYFAVFLEIDIEYIFLVCFIFVFIVNGRDYKNETSKKEFIIGNSVSSVVGAVILFAIIFGASGFLLDTLHDAKFNEEIDEIGYHNNTVTVDEFTQFGPDFSKAYWIVGDDRRKYTISEGMYNKLNTEYNNSVAGHKLNIFFNVKKTARSGHINYMADNITTDSGIIIK